MMDLSILTSDRCGIDPANLGLLPDLSTVAAEVAPALPALQQSAGAASGLGGGAGLPNAVLASVSRANSIGPLSVPASWSAPSGHAVSALSPAGLTTLAGTEEAAGSGMPGVPGMPAPTVARASGVLPTSPESGGVLVELRH